MNFLADLHIHSKFSMATARNLDLETLHQTAQEKGITVIGTGDITHPEWFRLISEKLVPAEPGLFRLKDDLAAAADAGVPTHLRSPVRFMLQGEISSIYKKNGRVRKNHNLVFLPDLDSARRFNARLDAIGNIRSDGRPILGLDSRNLLEILLETDPMAFLVPAHIWTPWFSALGSKSGFDSLDECFDDLAPHIFAAETGLSSDPDMNRMVSSLDRITLISNSDAHSPAKLGREANRFDTELSYFAMREALETANPDAFLGTFEFYPEEGKYHLDGHRKCGICFSPEESRKHGGICPVCGKKLTLGVMYRVMELADRKREDIPLSPPFLSIVPLVDILAEVLQKGGNTKTVQAAYRTALDRIGPEFHILHGADIESIRRAGIPLLGEAIGKLRSNDIVLSGGFDGEFGTVKIFSDAERRALTGQKSLFSVPAPKLEESRPEKPETLPFQAPASGPEPDSLPEHDRSGPEGLNPEQQAAVLHPPGPLMIVAGPGTGKTRTLTEKIVHRITASGTAPEHILAVTFTNKAAAEMTERLTLRLAGGVLPWIGTFHGISFQILRQQPGGDRICLADEDTRSAILDLALQEEPKPPGRKAAARFISDAKQAFLGPQDDLSSINAAEPLVRVYASYENWMLRMGMVDFDDLVFRCVRLFESDPEALGRWRSTFRHIFVDEYQDVNPGQFHWLKLLSGPEPDLCVIGDPDQAIYGFRGSDLRFFRRFPSDFPGAHVVRLARNYRSTETILEASFQVMKNENEGDSRSRIYSGIHGEQVISVWDKPSDRSEADAIAREVERLMGGTSHYSLYSGRAEGTGHPEYGFSDFAVLARTRAMAEAVGAELAGAGLPVQVTTRGRQVDAPGVADLVSLMRLKAGVATISDLRAGCGIPGLPSDVLNLYRKWAAEALPGDPVDVTAFLSSRFSGLFSAILDLPDAVGAGSTALDLMNHLLDASGLMDRISAHGSEAALETVRNLAVDAGSDFGRFFASLSLFSDTDGFDAGIQRVAVMTLHASKGLEFPVVFIAGCEDGMIPYRGRGQDADISEERRLFYVGMTRARDRLYLTRAKKRRVFGQTVETRPSPFVSDIESALKAADAIRKRSRKKNLDRQLPLFD